MPLTDDLNSYTGSNISDAGCILANIHKIYTINTIKLVLSNPKYREIYNKIKQDSWNNKRITILPRNTYKFKSELGRVYNRCPVTGEHIKLCDFAHIVPHSMCEPFEQDDPHNGIRIDMKIHRLWDAYDNWLELHPLDEINGTAVFKIPIRHIDNTEVNNTVSEFVNKPIYNISPNTFKYIKRRLEIDIC